MIYRLMAVGALALAIAGCETVGVPESSFEAPHTDSFQALADDLNARSRDYQKYQGELLERPQLYDVPTIFAALTSLGMVALGNGGDTAEILALGATGVQATRRYYDFGGRQVVFANTAIAYSCLAGLSTNLMALDQQVWKDRIALLASQGAMISDADIRIRVEAIVTDMQDARHRIAQGAVDVNAVTLSKVQVPSAPTFAQLAAAYAQNMQDATSATQKNEQLGEQLTNARAQGQKLFASALQTEVEALFAAKSLLKHLEELDAQIIACKGQAA